MRLFRRCHFLLVLVVIGLNSCEKNFQYQVKTEIIHLKSTDQIVMLHKRVVKPLVYTHISGLEKLPVDIAKAKFISAVLPSILIARYKLEQNEKHLKMLSNKIQWTGTDSVFYHKMKSRYQVKSIHELMSRMRALPVSIVLAQAAMESGWGRSRIFIKANNMFGVWSFNKAEPRIAALVKRRDKRVYLRVYPDIAHSVDHYFQIMGKAKSFKKLREALATTDDPIALLPHFRNYSERREAYTKQLKSLIEKNDLLMYDEYVLDPAYIIAHHDDR